MRKDRILNKIEKILRNIVLFPIWLAVKIVNLAFYIVGWVTSFGIVRTVLTVALGIAVLGSVITGLWSYAIILGIPILFVYLMPYISGYVSVFCGMITDKISGYWHTPADSGRFDPEEEIETRTAE